MAVKISNNELLFLKWVQKGYLRIDPDGSIWKLVRRRYDPKHNKVFFKKLKKPTRAETKFNHGYLGVQMAVKNGKKYVMAHRLVWWYYHGPIPEGYDINHIDGNRHNCHPDNLEMITHQENVQHAKTVLTKLRAEGKLAKHVDVREEKRKIREDEARVAENLAREKAEARRLKHLQEIEELKQYLKQSDNG